MIINLNFITMYEIGDRVIIAQDNDNENYDDFRDKVLIVTHIATSEDETPAYDSTMDGMQLMDFDLEEGGEFPFALYEYEVEYV